MAARARRSPSSYQPGASSPASSLGHPGGLAPAAGTSERGERGRAGDAELAVEITQSDDGGGVLGDGAVEAGRGAQHLLDGEVDDRSGHRLAAFVEQRRRPEHLGEAKDGEDVDGGGPAAPAERPSRHDAGRVGGDDDRHRDERVASLGRAHGGGERVEGARAVGDRRGVDRHPTIVRMGCDTAPRAGVSESGRAARSQTCQPLRRPVEPPTQLGVVAEGLLPAEHDHLPEEGQVERPASSTGHRMPERSSRGPGERS